VCILKGGAPVYTHDAHSAHHGYDVWSGPRASKEDHEMCFAEHAGQQVSHAHWMQIAAQTGAAEHLTTADSAAV
jgi:hypothetical protein